MRVRLRRGILNAVCGRGCPVQQLAVIGASARTIRRDWSGIPVAKSQRHWAGRGDAYVRRHVLHGQSDGWRHVDDGAPAMRVPQASRRPRSPSGRGSCSRRRCAREPCSRLHAARTQLEATVMGRTKLRKVHALLERGACRRCLPRRWCPGPRRGRPMCRARPGIGCGRSPRSWPRSIHRGWCGLVRWRPRSWSRERRLRAPLPPP